MTKAIEFTREELLDISTALGRAIDQGRETIALFTGTDSPMTKYAQDDIARYTAIAAKLAPYIRAPINSN